MSKLSVSTMSNVPRSASKNNSRERSSAFHAGQDVAGRTVLIPAEGKSAHCWGVIRYFAELAHPDEAGLADRDEFIRHVEAFASKFYISQGTKRRPRERKEQVSTGLRRIKNEKITGVLNRAFRRIINRRLPAASMAQVICLGGILKTEPFRAVWAVPNPKSVSVNDTVRWLEEMKYSLGNHRENIMNRIWVESKPVLHLAVALLQVVSGHPNAFISVPPICFDPFNLIGSPNWLLPALRTAEQWRQTVLPKFIPSFRPDEAVCLLPDPRYK